MNRGNLPGDAATLLRHRPPALLLGTIVRFEDTAIVCASCRAGRWEWPALLEGAAQTAGLLAGLQPGGPDNRAVIAELRDVRIVAPVHDGSVMFHAALERRLAGFWRCRTVVQSEHGSRLLEARVTVARSARPSACA